MSSQQPKGEHVLWIRSFLTTPTPLHGQAGSNGAPGRVRLDARSRTAVLHDKDDESLPPTPSYIKDNTFTSVITSAPRHGWFLGLLLRHMWRAFLWHCGLAKAPKNRVP